MVFLLVAACFGSIQSRISLSSRIVLARPGKPGELWRMPTRTADEEHALQPAL